MAVKISFLYLLGLNSNIDCNSTLNKYNYLAGKFVFKFYKLNLESNWSQQHLQHFESKKQLSQVIYNSFQAYSDSYTK